MKLSRKHFKTTKVIRGPVPYHDETGFSLVTSDPGFGYWLVHNLGDYQIWQIGKERVMKIFYLRPVVLPMKYETHGHSYFNPDIDRIRAQHRINRA